VAIHTIIIADCGTGGLIFHSIQGGPKKAQFVLNTLTFEF